MTGSTIPIAIGIGGVHFIILFTSPNEAQSSSSRDKCMRHPASQGRKKDHCQILT